jgi:hypothetical protein
VDSPFHDSLRKSGGRVCGVPCANTPDASTTTITALPNVTRLTM